MGGAPPSSRRARSKAGRHINQSDQSNLVVVVNIVVTSISNNNITIITTLLSSFPPGESSGMRSELQQSQRRCRLSLSRRRWFCGGRPESAHRVLHQVKL